ncbi:hypothetical protein LARI1_G007646 [Lachnellula arida]|uniref:Transcription factor domain-containing protein n=1 Tax=Lachnellula arida TaxID=1316785 RepID=A0A8T9BB13_9HELO|nr:hypothetical protein LARI1_G007646 [Lachnellula arida]
MEPTKPQKDPGFQNFGNEDEFRCFCLYREEVAPQLSYFNQSIWQTLLLLAGQDQDFIRHAIIAIGGLRRSTKLKGLERTGEENSSDLNAASLYEFALLHYDQFLAGIKTHIAVGTRDQGRRLAMISCLLVVCIESMQLHHQNALLHCQQGFKLIEELKIDNGTPDSNNRGGISSPAPSVIEDELLQQFDRMELQVLALYDTRTGEKHQILKDEGNLSVKNMPEAFMNIKDARRYLELIMRRTFHFMAYAHAEKSALLNFREVLEDASAFDNPVETSRALDIPDGLQVSHPFLGICCSQNMLLVHSSNTLKEAILTVGFHASRCNKRSINCRDRRLRRDALDLLCTRPWREAQWMSLVCADVARFKLETEEDGVETDHIPEWARVRLTGVDVTEKEWKGTLHGIRGVGDSAVLIQSVRNWSGMGD